MAGEMAQWVKELKQALTTQVQPTMDVENGLPKVVLEPPHVHSGPRV